MGAEFTSLPFPPSDDSVLTHVDQEMNERLTRLVQQLESQAATCVSPVQDSAAPESTGQKEIPPDAEEMEHTPRRVKLQRRKGSVLTSSKAIADSSTSNLQAGSAREQKASISWNSRGQEALHIRNGMLVRFWPVDALLWPPYIHSIMLSSTCYC